MLSGSSDPTTHKEDSAPPLLDLLITPHLEASINNKEDEHSEQESAKHFCMRISSVCAIVGQLAVSIKESADVGMSLAPTRVPDIVYISGGAAAFITTLEIDGASAKASFKEASSLIHLQLPKEWPLLAKNTERLATVLAAEPIVWSMGSELSQAYYFIRALPSDYTVLQRIPTSVLNVTSASIAVIAGLTILFTDGVDKYKMTRECFIPKPKTLENRAFNRIINPMSMLFGFFDALQYQVQTYVALDWIFNINNPLEMSIAGGFTLFNTLLDTFFNTKSGKNIFEDAYIFKQQHGLPPKAIAAVLLSATVSLYLAYLKRPLNQLFYKDVINDFNVDDEQLPEIVYQLLSWVIFVTESKRLTGALAPPMLRLIEKCLTKLSPLSDTIKNKWQHYFSSASGSQLKTDEAQQPLLQADAEEENNTTNDQVPISINTATSPASPSNNRFSLFNHFAANRIREETSKKNKRFSCGIM